MTNAAADVLAPYEDLTLRYRPHKLADLIGQDTAVKTVRGMIRSGKIVRKIMISGPFGLGKTTMARLVAMAINCKAPNDGDPCGECEPCKQIIHNVRDGSVHEINGANARKIEDAREMILTSQYAPRGFKYRTFIIDEIHQFTPDAFKSLLKVLEEPPPNTVFIICTTEPGKVPQEVRSRMKSCTLTVRPVSPELIAKYLRRVAKLEGTPIGTEPAMKLAKASRGHVRDALGLLEVFINTMAGGTDGEDIDVDQLLNDLLGDASDGMGIEFMLAVLKGDRIGALVILNKVFNHAVFCETVTRLAAHVVRATYDESNLLRDSHLGEFYDQLAELKLTQRTVDILDIFNAAAERVKSFQTNDPYAVMVAATVRASLTAQK